MSLTSQGFADKIALGKKMDNEERIRVAEAASEM